MTKTVPFFDGSRIYLQNVVLFDRILRSTLIHGSFINGPEVKEFASRLEKYLNVKHVIPCASGTDALTIALLALDLAPGSEVIIPAFGYIAAAEAALLLGLKPVFADVDAETFNLDPEKILPVITPNTKVIVPMHLFGLTSNMSLIKTIAREHGLKIIEDVAQAFGGTVSDKKLGTIGDIGCTSFFPTKNLACFGDGGAVFTNDDAFAKRIKMISSHGQREKYSHEILGMNSRLDSLQAAILLQNLEDLERNNARRQAIADKYAIAFENHPEVTIPNEVGHTYNQYSIVFLSDNLRSHFIDYLKKCGIGHFIYYSQTLPSQPVFKHLGIDLKQFPVAGAVCERILSLPINPWLTEEEVDYVCDCISNYRV